MKFSPKKIGEQTIVITGASSGIGLACAVSAAEKGANLVLSSRNSKALKEICARITSSGGQAAHVAGDISQPETSQRIANLARQEFGGFDTWINNAGVTMFGETLKTPLQDERRLFEVNFWGLVHGTKTALKSLEKKGGVIINLGSVLSERSVPLQGAYSASKHAVKAFTDALRMELEKEKTPVSVVLVKPSSVDTPMPAHAKNHMDEKAGFPPPYYDPKVVARVVMECAEKPRRDVVVGASGLVLVQSEKLFPRLLDRIMRAVMFQLQKYSNVPKTSESALYSAPKNEGKTRGDYPGKVLKRSLYTDARLHPARSFLFLAGAAGLAAMFTFGKKSTGQRK